MHARWLVEIATLFAVEGKLTSETTKLISSSAAHRYWAVSRERFEAWQQALSDYRDHLGNLGASERATKFATLRPVMEEIFLSDVLTRVVATYGARLEQQDHEGDLSPIAHNVFLSHEDVRNRCLRLLVSHLIPVDQAVALNRMRYALEHWTDAFIAQFSDDTTQLQYAFMPDRTADLIDEARERATDSAKLVAWQLMIASCQRWMNDNCRAVSASPELNQKLGEAVLAMIHPDRFPSLSPFPVAFSDRVTTLIDQANIWVSQLIPMTAVRG